MISQKNTYNTIDQRQRKKNIRIYQSKTRRQNCLLLETPSNYLNLKEYMRLVIYHTKANQLHMIGNSSVWTRYVPITRTNSSSRDLCTRFPESLMTNRHSSNCFSEHHPIQPKKPKKKMKTCSTILANFLSCNFPVKGTYICLHSPKDMKAGEPRSMNEESVPSSR